MSAAIDECRSLAPFDDRAFFARALAYGVRHAIIDARRLNAIREDAPKGMVQIAEFFGTQYLRPNIEEARDRLINLVSLCLEEKSGGSLEMAASSLRDNTFLSHSRGGSEMLKDIWALPEDTSLGIPPSRTQKQFLAEWSLRSLHDYRQLRARRQTNAATIAAARYLAEELGEEPQAIWTSASETVIRSALLTWLSGPKSPARLPDGPGFVFLLGALRKKGSRAQATKRLRNLVAARPEAEQDIIRRELGKIEREDLPLIMTPAQPLEEVARTLEPLYYLRDSGPEDIGRLDALGSKKWQTITQGKTDDHSLLTVFLCIATDTSPKPVLSRQAARALIRKARHDGLQAQHVVSFIRTCAPHAMQADLEILWEEFVPEVASFLLDPGDTTLIEAMNFLRENCVVR